MAPDKVRSHGLGNSRARSPSRVNSIPLEGLASPVSPNLQLLAIRTWRTVLEYKSHARGVVAGRTVVEVETAHEPSAMPALAGDCPIPRDTQRISAKGLNGGSGIRTHGRDKPYSGFQDRCIRPLCHPSDAAYTNSSDSSARDGQVHLTFAPAPAEFQIDQGIRPVRSCMIT